MPSINIDETEKNSFIKIFHGLWLGRTQHRDMSSDALKQLTTLNAFHYSKWKYLANRKAVHLQQQIDVAGIVAIAQQVFRLRFLAVAQPISLSEDSSVCQEFIREVQYAIESAIDNTIEFVTEPGSNYQQEQSCHNYLDLNVPLPNRTYTTVTVERLGMTQDIPARAAMVLYSLWSAGGQPVTREKILEAAFPGDRTKGNINSQVSVLKEPLSKLRVRVTKALNTSTRRLVEL